MTGSDGLGSVRAAMDGLSKGGMCLTRDGRL